MCYPMEEKDTVCFLPPSFFVQFFNINYFQNMVLHVVP